MRIPTILSVLALSLFAAGCTKDSKAGETPGKAAPLAMEAIEKLAKADAADGKTDKVVSKCVGCSLGMDGKDQFSLKVDEYTLHLCSQKCLDGVKADPGKAIMAMKDK